MPKLRELQKAFGASVLAQDHEGAEGSKAAAFIHWGKLTPQQQLQVYRNNYFLGMSEALRATYTVINELVSEGFFSYAADCYIRKNPSTTGDLGNFGDDFPEFIETFEPAAGHPYLGDVARLERAWHQVMHAADAAPLSGDQLQALATTPPENLHFRLHPASRLLESKWPIWTLWNCYYSEATESGRDHKIDLNGGGEQVLVIRPQWQNEAHLLAPGEFALLKALEAGQALPEAIAAALGEEAGMDVNEVLRHHVALGTLTEYF